MPCHRGSNLTGPRGEGGAPGAASFFRCRRRSAMRRSIELLARLTGFAALIFALALAPALLSSSAFAAPKKRTCMDRLFDCHKRCSDAASKKYGTNANKGSGPANDAAAACAKRTCDHQFKQCVAAEKGSKNQPLTPQKATRSPGTAPTQPLKPQKATKSPTSAPTQPLTPQNATKSPANAPTRR